MGHYIDGVPFYARQHTTGPAETAAQTLTCAAGQQIVLFNVAVGTIAAGTASELSINDSASVAVFGAHVGNTPQQLRWDKELPLKMSLGAITCSISASGTASIATQYGVLR